MKTLDIGANLCHRQFASDRDAVLARATAAGVVGIVVTGTSVRTSQEALALARQHPLILRATAGIHPHDAKHADAL